jgi:DNA-binding NarL/FixJ family response regulator
MRLSRAAPTTFLPLEPWRHAKAALILLVEPNSCQPPTVPQLLLRHVRGAVVGTDAGLREFLASVDAAVRADQVPSPALRAAASEEGRGAMRRLSRRERQVLQMVAEGLTSKEIAVEMGLSAKTVARHRENLPEKLGGGIADLTRLAVRLGLVEP